MKLIKIKSLIAALTLISASSCESYLLEENPNQVTTESYWANLDQTKATIYSAYAGLRSEYILNIRTEAWRSDMGWPGYGRPQPQNNADGWSYYCQTYNNSSKFVINKWNDSYIVVWRANQAIEALEKLSSDPNVDQVEWTKQMAEARFVRGLIYFYLYSSFNDGSVVLKSSIPKVNADFYQSLSPAEEVYSFYVADLEYAYENLPDVSEEETLPAKPAAATILGTSYLYKSDYDKASEYFNDVITNNNYSLKLETDLSKMFTTAGEFNSESILEIPYSTEHRTDYGDWDSGRMINPLGLFSKNIMGFLMPAWISNAYLTDPIDPKVAMNYEDGELRTVSQRASSMGAFVLDQSSLYYGKYAVEQGQELAGGPKAAWGFGKYKKYTNHDIWTLETSPRSGKNVTVNRLSDVYLMYAECLLQGGDIQGALDYINDVRKRWGLVLLGTGSDTSRTYNGIDYTAETLMDHLMYVERPLELSVEGHQIRWQDLRRWGLLKNDDKNIFKRHAAETFYAVTPTGLVTTTGDPATMVTKFSTIVTEEPETGVVDTDYVVVDYEYDEAAANFSIENNLYYGISSDEELNNPNL